MREWKMRRLRKRGVRRQAGRRGRIMLWLALLTVEAAVFGIQALPIRLFYRERTCVVEWIDADDGAREQRYGVRFSPKNWEIQFYHQWE